MNIESSQQELRLGRRFKITRFKLFDTVTVPEITQSPSIDIVNIEFLNNTILLLLPIRPLKDWKRMCFRIEDPLIERYHVILAEE